VKQHLHTICRHVIQSNSWLLMVKSQIDTLIPNPSFSHNLCFKYSNGSCKPILDIYAFGIFQWYKKVFNIMNFDPSNCSLKIWDSIQKSNWECVTSFPHILSPSWKCECDFQVAFLTRIFPCPCLGREFKTRVMIHDGTYPLNWLVNIKNKCLIKIKSHQYWCNTKVCFNWSKAF
jgi:hypothetical protein